MKTKILNQLFSSCKKWKTLVLISMLLTLGVGQMWGVDFTGGKIYFRNDVTKWTTAHIQIFAHQSGYTWVSGSMSSVPNTKLYYINASCNWGGFNGYRICGNASAWNSGSFTDQGSSTKYTNKNTSYGLNSGSIYLITPASASNGCSITPTYYSSNDNFLKYTATAKVKTSTNGSSYTTVTTGTWPATVNIKGTYLSGDGATTRSDVSTNSGASGSYDAVATGLITMTYSSLSSDYAFAGWGTGNTPSSTNESYEYNIDKATTVYAFFKKKYTVTFDANGHGTAPSSQTIVAGGKASTPTAPTAAGWTFGGWYKEAECTNAWNFSTDVVTANTILYAKWTEDAVYYTVNYGVHSSGNGTLAAKNTSTSASIATGASILSGTSVTFTATPSTGYTVEGWYTNSACSSGKHDAGNTSYVTTISAATNVYVKFVEKTWSVAFAAETGGSVTTPAATPQTVGQLTGINIAATPSTGYTFKQWTITSGSGSFTSAATTNSNKFKPTAASTITASFNETKSTITVTTATSSQGSLKFGSTAKSWGTTASLGVATKQNITATAASGYKFVRWDLSGAAATSSSTTSATITLKADGSGDTGTATAVFEEDLSSPWIVAGGNKIVTTGTTWRTTADANNTMFKKTGHSTESVVYFTVPVTTVCSGDNNGNFQFKIYNTSTSTWYSLGADGSSYYLLKAEGGKAKSLVTDGKNIELRAYVTGNYEFKLDYSTSTPKLTVTWPVYNQLRFYSAQTGGTGTNTYDFNTASTPWTKTVNLTAGSTYWFKVIEDSEFFGNTGTMTRTNSSNWTMSNVTENCGITPDFDGDYTFSYNPTTNVLSVTYPVAYKLTYDIGTVKGGNGSITSSPTTSSGSYVLSGNSVTLTAPDAKTGYTWKGWYLAADGSGTRQSSAKAYAVTMNADKTLYACYNLVTYTITYNLNGGTNPVSPAPPTSYTIESANIALPTPTKEGYVFAGWYSDSELTTPVSTIPTGSTGNKAFWAKWDQKGTYTIYYYNKDSWANTHAYIWDGGSGTNERAWPGEQMFIHQGKVYKHDYVLSTVSYDKVIFNNGLSGGDERKTADLNIADGLGGNQWFYNPNDASVDAGSIHHGWSQYIMVADFPTTKQVAVVGEKITIEPVISWADVIEFDDITITATKTSGSSNITAMAAGTKIIATATAAGEATYTVTYSYSTTTITKTLTLQFTAGITVQAKIATTDTYWTDTDKEKIHYWGTGIAGDITMTWIKNDGDYNYYQALVPLDTDSKTNFLFYYDYMKDEGSTKWHQTDNITNVTADCCYTISFSSETAHSTKSGGAGICSDSYQLVITMGSGDIYTSNIVTSSDEIVSFFAPSNANESKTYRQGTVTLEHNGATVATLPANIFNASGVYTAKIKTTSPYGLTNLALYEGNYYIRTDGADGGWDNYTTNPDNLMTEFTRNSNFPNETFSYYWVKNVAKNKTENIKATVANDYNPVLCNFTADETANAADGVNLRFGYEPTTNDIVRGIIGGATTNNFLNIICADGSQIYKEMACTTLLNETLYASSPGDSKFQDKSNWVYEVIVYAKIDASHPVANVVLKSYYYGIHYLLGMVKDSYGRETSTPVSFPVIKTGTTPGVYGLRVVYDFKTNRLFAAWAPADRVIDGVLDVDADVMFLRHEDGDAAQISFKTDEAKVTDIKQAIFALELDNEKAPKGSGNIERHYFISLPFDCKVSNIFGIGGFMNYWGIQRYNGAKRAQIGWFQETPTFWEWLSADDVMQAGEGYLLSVDKKALQNDGVWKDGIVYQKQETIINPATHKPYKAVDGTDSVAWVTYTDGSLLTMYFPSTTSGFTITPATGEALTLTYPDQPCSITRENRDKKDSNWKCIGTPGYKNITISNYSQSSPELVENAAPNFLYVFNEQTSGAQYAKGTYSVTNGRTFTYHSFNSYMVQFAGTVDWAQYSKGTEVSPIAPKRIVAAEEKTTDVQLNLMGADNNELDRTFVWMRENATIGFDQNYDLNKMIENKANQIYSLAENDIPFAANVLPLGTDTVKLVVNIANDGEFSFSVDADKHVGMAPVLYDMYQMTETDLLSADYTIDLKKGKYADRFFLIFKAAQPIVTSFETTADGGQNVHSSEAIYDVLGRRVNTIYPGHLYIVNGEKRIAK